MLHGEILPHIMTQSVPGAKLYGALASGGIDAGEGYGQCWSQARGRLPACSRRHSNLCIVLWLLLREGHESRRPRLVNIVRLLRLALAKSHFTELTPP